MTDQLHAKIAKYEASMSQLNKNNPKDSTLYQYYKDMIKRCEGMLTKPKVNLYTASDSVCESCEG